MRQAEKHGIMSLLFGHAKETDAASRRLSAHTKRTAAVEIIFTRRPAHPPKQFVVFDFETSDRNSTEAEILEIGAVKYVNGKAVDSFETLIRPVGEISPMASRVNGITNEMLTDAPSIQQVMPDFLDFINGFPLVAYNGFSFDYKVLERVCRSLGQPLRTVAYDAYQDAKLVLTRPQSHKLEYLRQYYGLEGTDHRALDDAIVAGEIWKMCFPSDFSKSAKRARWADSRPAPPVPPKDSRQIYRGKALPYRPDLYPSKIVSGQSSPFWGKQCVVTGELHITRPEAEALITKAGGMVRSSVSRTTDFLIVGQQDLALVGDDGMSTKEERAEEINSKGQGHIQRLTERQFCAMLAAYD